MPRLFVLLTMLLLLPPGPTLAGQRDGPALRLWEHLNTHKLRLRSKAALVVDHFGNTLYAKHADQPMPIASITKLMTAMVVLDARQRLDEIIEIKKADRDLKRLTGSRLHFGARLSRRELLLLALMSSENRAARALARRYPGGEKALVRNMNRKAVLLGMHDSRFSDPAGLDADNVASARDLARLVRAASRYPLIVEATTTRQSQVRPYQRRGALNYVNTNRLVRGKRWQVYLSKTGYINEAGRCLVMETEMADQPVVVILLNSFGKYTPFGDANRIRKWLENGASRALEARLPATPETDRINSPVPPAAG